MIFVDWFIPGYKAGGQIQSIANLAYALFRDMDIYIVTSDRDYGDTKCYTNVIADKWTQSDEGIKIYYISPAAIKYRTIAGLIQDINPHAVYLNSMYSFPFTIMPLIAHMLGKTKASYILAPRGMLHKGALQFKKGKKQFFLKLFSWLGLSSRIIFHATDETEQRDIKNIFGPNVRVKLIGDYHVARMPSFVPLEKKEGNLKCLFISRISQKKNLLYLLEVISEIKASVELTIIGPVESESYWNQCSGMIKKMPDNIKVSYKGPIPNQELGYFYQQNHLFSLLTYGENFGHVIFDAFVNGRPALISDQTPWKQLQQKKTGWEIDLQHKKEFMNALEHAARWNQEQFDIYCKHAYSFAGEFISTSDLKKKYLSLFNS